MLFASDLDRTLIHSSKFITDSQAVTCIEVLDGKEISYMTQQALDLLAQVKKRENVCLVPTTTRSLAQFSRIKVFQDLPYAIVANGGYILEKGQPLPVWQAHIQAAKERQAKDYPTILAILDRYAAHLTRTPSLVDDLFFFTKLVDDKLIQENILSQLEEDLQGLDWTFTLQGLKLYIIPKEVSKENALAFLKDYLKEDTLITSGDGKLDAGFLALGHVRMVPKNSEVYHLIADKRDYTIVADGMQGAEEILKTVLDQSS